PSLQFSTLSLHDALPIYVLVYDPYKSAAEIKAAGCEAVSDLEPALSRADFVSIHCPKTAETVGMFNAARLKRMKPTAYLINTARSEEHTSELQSLAYLVC